MENPISQIGKSPEFKVWLADIIEGLANENWNGSTVYTRIADFATHPPYKLQCERCLSRGEWIIANICARCHRFTCGSCARLASKDKATVCHECYIFLTQDFAAISHDKREKRSTRSKRTIHPRKSNITRKEGKANG